MTVQSRFETLQSRHATLESRIDDEGHRPMPNYDELTRLKREKLRVKEEMERLREHAAPS